MNFRSIRFSRRHLLYCTCTTIATGAVLLGYRSPALAQPVASRPTNVQVSHDNYPTHAEPYLALNPRQPRNLLGAAMLMGPQHIPTLPGTFSSFDGGRTWQDTGPLPLPPNTNYGNDVTAAFNASGTAFVCSMCTVQNSDGSISRPDRGAYIWRSEDGGRSFHEPIAVIGGQFVDHPWLAVDRTPGPQGGKLYVSWKQDRPGPDFQQQIALSVSDDSGQSWSAPQIISGSDQLVNAAMIATGLNGLVYVVYLNNPLKSKQSATEGDDEPGDKLPPTPTMQDVRVVYSLDYGQHFSEPLTVGQQPEPVQLLSQVELSTLPTIALHPHTNEVYVAYVSQSTGASHAEIMLTHAAHGKSAWSAPRSVFPDAAAKGIYYFQPQLAVNEAGRIALSAFAYEDGKIHVVLARFHSPDLSLQNRLVVTSQPFDPTLASSGGGFSWFIGDYQGLTSGPETFYPFWNDTRTGKLEIFTAAV